MRTLPHTEPERADAWSRLVIEAAPNAMLMIDARRVVLLANRGAELLFGYPRDELVGQAIDKLLPDRYRATHEAHVTEFFARPGTRAMGVGRELFGLRKDGSEVRIEIGLNPLDTGDGICTLASIIDISERKRAEATIEQLAAIVESSEDAILSTCDGLITSWNGGAERLFGYRADEALAQPTRMLVPEPLQALEQRMFDEIRRGERANHFETSRLRKGGAAVEVSVRVSSVRNAQGELVGESQIVRDITELKRRDAELSRSNAELEQFAYVASHDLQEPLRMVVNYTELLAKRYAGKLDAKADKFIFYAADGARRMQKLVADLLAFSRVGSEGRALAAVSTDIVVRDVLRALSSQIREAAAQVEVGELPAWVLADETQLGQLFQNLVGNAIKFRAALSPVVKISAVRSGELWTFAVADNGIGIEARHAERIFQMFQRLHERSKYEGSGIGLAIAQRIVERHGGRIWFESLPGAGTTFFFTLREHSNLHVR